MCDGRDAYEHFYCHSCHENLKILCVECRALWCATLQYLQPHFSALRCHALCLSNWMNHIISLNENSQATFPTCEVYDRFAGGEHYDMAKSTLNFALLVTCFGYRRMLAWVVKRPRYTALTNSDEDSKTALTLVFHTSNDKTYTWDSRNGGQSNVTPQKRLYIQIHFLSLPLLLLRDSLSDKLRKEIGEFLNDPSDERFSYVAVRKYVWKLLWKNSIAGLAQ
jgi:hypothetical protein